jgi:hypothetical protein
MQSNGLEGKSPLGSQSLASSRLSISDAAISTRAMPKRISEVAEMRRSSSKLPYRSVKSGEELVSAR